MAFWMGKAMGGMFGLMTGGPLGMMFGAFAGHLFDQNLERFLGFTPEFTGSLPPPDSQKLFFNTLFVCMGHLAKADGRVNEQEIAAASFIMDRLGLSGSRRDEAIARFNQGKELGQCPEEDLARLRSSLTQSMSLMFLEVLLTQAYCDGPMGRAEKRCILAACEALGISHGVFDRTNERVKEAVEQALRGGQHSQQELHDAYRLLGVTESASDDELKQAYRRQMSCHHPDKLSASGASEEELCRAKEMTQQIQTAYALLRRFRMHPDA